MPPKDPPVSLRTQSCTSRSNSILLPPGLDNIELDNVVCNVLFYNIVQITLEHPVTLVLNHPVTMVLNHPVSLVLNHPVILVLNHSVILVLDHPVILVLNHPVILAWRQVSVGSNECFGCTGTQWSTYLVHNRQYSVVQPCS